jgi:hypothetical protein
VLVVIAMARFWQRGLRGREILRANVRRRRAAVMQRITMVAQFRGKAAAPAGEPPRTDPRATSTSIEAVTDDGTATGIERASYENHVVYTGESTFSETGTIRFGDVDDELEVATVADGTLGPSAEADVLHGAVVYRITGGGGRFDAASGLITSNFLLWPATGEFEERQVAIVFVEAGEAP